MTETKREFMTALQIAEPQDRYELNLDLVKATIMPPEAKPGDLMLFIEQCKRTRLDPFAKQIYPIMQKDPQRGYVLRTQVSIDGMRVVAERSGQYDGQDGPFWYDGKDWKDVWISDKNPLAAKVIVYRKGSSHGITGVAHWTEYAQPHGFMWKKMPALMLGKVAESLALRKAFPNDLSGLYSTEEMDQADKGKQSQAARTETAQRIVDVESTTSAPPLPAPESKQDDFVLEETLEAIGLAVGIAELDNIGKAIEVGKKEGRFADADLDAIRNAYKAKGAELRRAQ